jgi:hypothetical protein
MKGKLFILLIICLQIKLVNAQSYLLDGKIEFGIQFGGSNFLGELGGTSGTGKTFLKDNNIPLTKKAFGEFITINPKEWIGFRIGATHTTIEGNDALLQNKSNTGGAELTRLYRNLSFKSKITEVFGAIEIIPTEILECFKGRRIRPEFFAGIGIVKFNPKTLLNGEWIELRPLHTEGQGFSQYPTRKEYGKTAITYPVGFGFKYYMSSNLLIGVDVIYRFTNTDYLDDVSTNYIDPAAFDANLSPANALLARQLNNRNIAPANLAASYTIGSQRGDPRQNDGFYTFAAKIGWRIDRQANQERNILRNQRRCPHW